MRIAKWFLVLLMAAVVFVVACMVNETVALVVMALYFVAGVALLVKAIRAVMRKLPKKKPAQPVRQPAPVEAPPQVSIARPVPPPAPQPETKRPASLPYTCEGMERRYHYASVDVYVPDVQRLRMPGLAVGTPLTLYQEKNNEYDPKAVALMHNGSIIAYLYRNGRQDMANDWIRKGMPVLAMVSEIAADGLKIALAFYDLPKFERMMQANPSPKKYRLVRTASQAVQDVLVSCDEGDELEIEEDEEGRYTLTNYIGDVAGCLSASAAEFVDDNGGPERCSVFIAETDYNDSGKLTTSVYIFRGK